MSILEVAGFGFGTFLCHNVAVKFIVAGGFIIFVVCLLMRGTIDFFPADISILFVSIFARPAGHAQASRCHQQTTFDCWGGGGFYLECCNIPYV